MPGICSEGGACVRFNICANQVERGVPMYKVLIVDDEPMVIHGLCRQIDWESYGLELAGTAETGESTVNIQTENY